MARDDGDEMVDFSAANSNTRLNSHSASEWSNYLNDGVRLLDFVLVYNKNDKNADNLEKRDVFERNLRAEGLVLEHEDSEMDLRPASSTTPATNGDAVDGHGHEHKKLAYVKVHAPLDLVSRYAEALKMHMPLRESIQKLLQSGKPIRAAQCKKILEDEDRDVATQSNAHVNTQPQQRNWYHKVLHHLHLYPDLDDLVRHCTIVFNRSRLHLFESNSKGEPYFRTRDRIYIVNYILQRKSYSILSELANEESKEPDAPTRHRKVYNHFGINRLLKDHVYLAAFPIHDCPLNDQDGSKYSDAMRYKLFHYWASWRSICKLQPLNYIETYFGEAIAWYFAWMGFYTGWLIPVTLFGIIVFAYGMAIAWTDSLTVGYCNLTTIMCPLCLTGCSYWTMASQCMNVVIVRIFSNDLTFAWGCIMALWCTMLLEFWKRRRYRLKYEWSLLGNRYDEEPPRPEFAKLADLADHSSEGDAERKRRNATIKLHKNPVTGKDEPSVAFWRLRVPNYMVSVFSILFGLVLALACITGVIVYRVAIETIVNKTGEAFLTSYGSLIASVTGACVNLVVIMLLSIVYNRIAIWLTDREYWRTQTEYNNALSMKLALLQFVNYFASIFYIAFFKGQFSSVANYAIDPNSTGSVDFRIESCAAGSCIAELCIQLLIIMVGDQLLNNLVEIYLPKIKAAYKDWCDKKKGIVIAHSKNTLDINFHLEEMGSRPLFDEYLEIALQYGFLSMFAIAFPLAPLFALINNIFEIRIDARKFVMARRRSVPEQADSAIWDEVMSAISTVAILSNGALIAFTSSVIPSMVYRSTTTNWNIDTYENFTLAYFDTKYYAMYGGTANRTLTTASGQGGYVSPAYCRYSDYRNPPWSASPNEPYDLSHVFWLILAWRFIVIVIFENVVMIFTYLVAAFIPDVPASVKERQRREAYLTRQLLLKLNIQAAKRKEKAMKAFGGSPVRKAARRFSQNPESAVHAEIRDEIETLNVVL